MKTDERSPGTADVEGSAWRPFHYTVFTLLWVATVVSNIGSWMQNAAAGWLMTSLRPDPFEVALVQAATTLPMFLFSLPAGALADIIDRRRLLIVVQIALCTFLLAFAGLFVRTFQQRLAENERRGAITMAETLLGLNPDDNHGLRFMLVNEYLRQGCDAEALALAEQFPQDVAPETRFGAVLALVRMQRLQDAERALQIARTDLPKTAQYLLPPRIRRPKLTQGRIQFGGDDQAWFYRDEMRAVWQQTPGALEWLREHS